MDTTLWIGLGLIGLFSIRAILSLIKDFKK